ncbi:MAG: hypothetical protein ACN23H_01740 [Candidatus Phytoplasma vitis]|nr:MAG: hypothetical protein M6G77_01420 [Candidatus Phytoplasma vitis]
MANEEKHYPNYDKPHELSGSKYLYFLGSLNKKDFYTVPVVLKDPFEKQEEWITKKQILNNETDKNIKNYVVKNYGEDGEYIYKCIHNGTTIKDEMDLLDSGNKI